MRLAAARGLEAVSLRHVAAEAGVSTGMVQHYFRTKDEMMTFALDVVADNVQARLAADANTDGEAPSPKSAVRALLIQMLPLDETRLREGHVALAYQAYAAVKPDLAAGLRENTGRMREFIADQLRTAQSARDGVARVDPDHAATALFALAEGLGVHAVGQHYSPDEALASLDALLDVFFGSAPSGPDAA